MLYRIHRLITWSMVIVSPVRLATSLVIGVPVTAHAQAATTSAPYKITLDATQPAALNVQTAPKPDFDTDVLQPLQAAQATQAHAEAEAQAAAKAATLAAAKAAQTQASIAAPTGDDAFAQIRYCEAGGDYTRNSGNGYYGAYQYNLSTWNNYGGYARPDLAPAAVQDAKAHEDVARRGWSPWPACARKAGLL